MNETTDPTVVIETPEVEETKLSRVKKFAKKLLPYAAVAAITLVVTNAIHSQKDNDPANSDDEDTVILYPEADAN